MGVLLLSLTAPIATLAIAQQETVTPTSEPDRDMPIFVVSGGWGRLKVGFLFNISYEEALNLSYIVRNLTYDLFEWEIGYNISAAEVQLKQGDKFLNKSLVVSSESPREAAVYAFVAAIHYSHAPALANPVLGRVIHENLGENNTITEETVRAVNETAYELRVHLLNAVSYARGLGYNTTVAESLLGNGDEKLREAEELLSQGNVTCAFRSAVSAYRIYVRAFGVLVKTVIAQFMREQVKPLTAVVIEVKEPPARKLFNVLPVQIRDMIRERVEKGELKSMGEIIKVIKDEAMKIREQLREREKENLKIAVKNMVGNLKKEFRNINVSDEDLDKLVEKYYAQGYRGIDLAKKVLTELANRLQEQARERVMQQLNPPPRPMSRGK
jgi:Arc/MetJ-type ribon-helix-helix transcriptional regulator